MQVIRRGNIYKARRAGEDDEVEFEEGEDDEVEFEEGDDTEY